MREHLFYLAPSTALTMAIVVSLREQVEGFPQMKIHTHSFVKRDLAQLTALLVKDTPYTFYKLSSYGNWCGRGGDKMGDGSYVDGCDLCCKHHDLCYHKARTQHKGCNPLFTQYNYKHGEQNPDVQKVGIDSEEQRELERQRKLPSCTTAENEAPSCKEAICQCDMQLAICLKKEPCDPQTVSKKSRFWWLPG